MSAGSSGAGAGLNSSGDAGSEEEFFIDAVLAGHARKLLTAGSLPQLGIFFAQFPDFPAVSWLRKESSGAARVGDWVWAVAKLHHEFSWAWPGAGDGGGVSRGGAGWEAGKLVADNLAQLYIDTGTPARETVDSGYVVTAVQYSLSSVLYYNERYLSQPVRPDAQSHTSLLTVDAMLRIKDGGAAESCLSDCEELGSVCGAASPPCHSPRQEAGTGVGKTEAQLTYLLHLTLEADCLEWAACLAILLMDVMAVIRYPQLEQRAKFCI